MFVPNWIGDMAMATPTLRRSGDIGPNGRDRRRSCDPTWPTCWPARRGSTDRFSTIRAPSERKIESGGVLAKLREERFDTIVLLTNSLRSAALAWASGARQRVGYVRYGRGPLLTHKLYPSAARQSLVADAGDRLLFAIGLRDWLRAGIAATGTGHAAGRRTAADELWRRHELPPGDRVVVLNSGGAYGEAKLWPSEYFAQLARRIATEQDLAVLVTCGPAERAMAEADRRPGRPSARGERGRQADFDRAEQGLHPPQPATGEHGQRTAVFRRGVRRAGRFALWPDRHRLDPHALPARDLPATRRPLRTVRPANVPAGTSRLHAIVDRRAGVRGRARATGRFAEKQAA